jgi:hypothetical protein
MEEKFLPKKFRAWDGSRMVDVYELTIYPDGSTKVNDNIDSHYEKWPVVQCLLDEPDRVVYEGDIIEAEWGFDGVVEAIPFFYSINECTLSSNAKVIGHIYE